MSRTPSAPPFGWIDKMNIGGWTHDRLAADGYGLVGDIGQYEHIWRMAYLRGPEGIIVSLAERIG